MNKSKLTPEEMALQIEELTRKQADFEKKSLLSKANEFSLGGKVTKMNLAEGKPRMKKTLVDGKEVQVPVNDEQGNPTFWDDAYYLTVAFFGGEESFKISIIEAGSLKVNDDIHVSGHISSRGLQLTTITAL